MHILGNSNNHQDCVERVCKVRISALLDCLYGCGDVKVRRRSNVSRLGSFSLGHESLWRGIVNQCPGYCHGWSRTVDVGFVVKGSGIETLCGGYRRSAGGGWHRIHGSHADCVTCNVMQPAQPASRTTTRRRVDEEEIRIPYEDRRIVPT